MPPNGKYAPYHSRFAADLPDRTWPGAQLLKAPELCSVDLRDGNQALRCPMTVDKKLKLYDALLKVGFRQIEIGYPSASAVEGEFARALVQEKRIPHGVKPQVLTATAEKLIRGTFDAIKGGPETIVHVYNSTSRLQRDIVFKMSKDETIERAVVATKLVRHLADKTSTPVQYQYSPESFSGTEREFALDVCNAVIEAWEATLTRPIIINLPSTVEMSMPNVFADLVEWVSRHLKRRDAVILSVHPHNDRGTAVAAAELALLAGAQRIEGTLFGNGERAGNLDLVVLALNLYTQGIDPGIWLGDMPWLREVYESTTGETVPNRHPYSGDASPIAYSGTHQLAIRRCLKHRETNKEAEWNVAYLPIDFADIGRSYRPIGINGLSGKNGMAFVLETDYGVLLPKGMEEEFAAVVQPWCDTTGVDAPPEKIWSAFHESFLCPSGPIALNGMTASRDGANTSVELALRVHDRLLTVSGSGETPLCATLKALDEIGLQAAILQHESATRTAVSPDEHVAFVQIERDGRAVFGVGINADPDTASLRALMAAVNRSFQGNGAPG